MGIPIPVNGIYILTYGNSPLKLRPECCKSFFFNTVAANALKTLSMSFHARLFKGRHVALSLEWRHNGRDGVSNHQPHDCLLNSLFRRRSKKTSKLRVTCLWVGNSPVAVMTSSCQKPGPWFNIKMSSYQYRNSHCGDKTILRPSYLHNGISYTGKMTYLYWISPQWVKRNSSAIWESIWLAVSLRTPMGFLEAGPEPHHSNPGNRACQ